MTSTQSLSACQSFSIDLKKIVSPNNEMYNKTSKVLSVCQTNTFQRHWEVSI